MTRILVMAKAPVPGEAKTRLGAVVGPVAAAELAAAALLDTLLACAEAFPETRRHLALTGDLEAAISSDEIARSLEGWDVFEQVGPTFAERLAHAHATVADRGSGPVVQIGMDTPQVTPTLLLATAAGLGCPDDSAPDAVLGRCSDGGWWVLAMRDGRQASCLVDVEMSTSRTYEDTLAALTGAGLRVSGAKVLRDVDTVADAEYVASLAGGSRFADAWRRWVAHSDRSRGPSDQSGTGMAPNDR